MDLLLVWGMALLEGFAYTLLIALCAFLLGMLIGLSNAFCYYKNADSKLAPSSTFVGYCKNCLLRLFSCNSLIQGYVVLLRGVPEILVLYLLLFGSKEVLYQISNAFGYAHGAPDLSGVFLAVIALGVISGAYLTEVFRGGLLAIPKEQFYTSKAMGMPDIFIFFKILLPQLFRYTWLNISNIMQLVVKDTALASLVGAVEVVRVAQVASGSSGRPFLFFIVISLLFLLVGLLIDYFFNSKAIKRRILPWA